MPDLDNYLHEIGKQSTRSGKDAWVSRYLFDGLRGAPPLREQAWLMNPAFFERAMILLAGEEAKPGSAMKFLLNNYDRYLPAYSKCKDPEVLEKYRTACTSLQGRYGPH